MRYFGTGETFLFKFDKSSKLIKYDWVKKDNSDDEDDERKEEEKFEMTKFSPAVKEVRRERQVFKGAVRSALFAGKISKPILSINIFIPFISLFHTHQEFFDCLWVLMVFFLQTCIKI